MKAGIAGSSPDGVSPQNNASIALANFLQDIGDAVFSLNTTVVGLDAVEKGHEKPESLDISWSPIDRRAAARKTRKFVLQSVLIHVSAAINQYVIAVSKLPGLSNIRVRWERHQADDSAATKLADVAAHVVGEHEYLVAAAVLLVHWRNRIVHRSSKANISR